MVVGLSSISLKVMLFTWLLAFRGKGGGAYSGHPFSFPRLEGSLHLSALHTLIKWPPRWTWRSGDSSWVVESCRSRGSHCPLQGGMRRQRAPPRHDQVRSSLSSTPGFVQTSPVPLRPLGALVPPWWRRAWPWCLRNHGGWSNSMTS